MPDPRWHFVLIITAPPLMALIAASASALLRAQKGCRTFTLIALIPAFVIQAWMLEPGGLLATRRPDLDRWLIQADFWTMAGGLILAVWAAWMWWPRRVQDQPLPQPAPWSWASRIALALALPVVQLPALVLATAGDDPADPSTDRRWHHLRIARLVAAVACTPLVWLLPSAPVHAVACIIAALLPGPWRSMLATAAAACLVGWLAPLFLS